MSRACAMQLQFAANNLADRFEKFLLNLRQIA